MRSRDRNLEKCPPTFTEPFEEKMLVILGINRGNFQNCLCEPDLAGDTCPEDPLRYSSMTYYPSDGLLRDSCGLLLVFPLSSRDYLALHLSAALLDYRASRSTQLRTTSVPRLFPALSSYLAPSCLYLHPRCMRILRLHRASIIRVVIFTPIPLVETMFRVETLSIVSIGSMHSPANYNDRLSKCTNFPVQ